MSGLEDCGSIADISAWRDAESADQAGTEVAENITVEVGQDEDVVEFGLLDQLHAHIIDDAVLEFDVGVFLGDIATDVEPETVGEFHDIGLVDAGDLLSAELAGVVEGEPDDTARPCNGDRLDAYAGILCDMAGGVLVDPVDYLVGVVLALFVFDACIEVLCVLADDDQVDI